MTAKRSPVNPPCCLGGGQQRGFTEHSARISTTAARKVISETLHLVVAGEQLGLGRETACF